MKRLILLFTISTLLSGCKIFYPGYPHRAEYKFILPDAKITERQLCGKKDCVPGDLGTPFSFTKKNTLC
jgi:hypothetical protein